MERCPGDDDYFLPNAVESRTQHRFQMCRPPSALAPAQTFGGGHQYFEVLFSANRDVALYPSSAFFSMALSRQYMGVKAIRVASVSTAVPEVPSPQGISNFGTNQHGLCTQTTHFPVEAVPRTTWLPHHEGWIVDSGSFFPDIQNDQLCLESALQVNHSMADVPLAASLNRPLEPVPEFISPFEPAVRISTVVEDEQGRVYPYSSRPPPTYAAPPPQPAPVLQTPTPYEIQGLSNLTLPHTVVQVECMWSCTQYCWVQTVNRHGYQPDMTLQWISNAGITSITEWRVVASLAEKTVLLVPLKVIDNFTLDQTSYLVAPRVQGTSQLTTYWNRASTTNGIAAVLIRPCADFVLQRNDVFCVSQEGYPNRPTASTKYVSVPQWISNASCSNTSTWVVCSSFPIQCRATQAVWVLLQCVTVSPVSNCLGPHALLTHNHSNKAIVLKCHTVTNTVSSILSITSPIDLRRTSAATDAYSNQVSSMSIQNSSQSIPARFWVQAQKVETTGTLQAMLGAPQLADVIACNAAVQISMVWPFAVRYCPIVPCEPPALDIQLASQFNLIGGAHLPLALLLQIGPVQYKLPLIHHGLYSDATIALALQTAIATALTMHSELALSSAKLDKTTLIAPNLKTVSVCRDHTNRWVITVSTALSILFAETPETRNLAFQLGFAPNLNLFDATKFVAHVPTASSSVQPGNNVENTIQVKSFAQLPPISLANTAAPFTLCSCGVNKWITNDLTTLQRGTVLLIHNQPHLILDRCDNVHYFELEHQDICVKLFKQPTWTTTFTTVGLVCEDKTQAVALPPLRNLFLNMAATPTFRARGTFLGFAKSLFDKTHYLATSAPFPVYPATLLFLRLSPCPNVTGWLARTIDNTTTTATSSILQLNNTVSLQATLPIILYGAVQANTHCECQHAMVEFPTPQTISSVQVCWVDEINQLVDFRGQSVRMVLQLFCDPSGE